MGRVIEWKVFECFHFFLMLVSVTMVIVLPQILGSSIFSAMLLCSTETKLALSFFLLFHDFYIQQRGALFQFIF